MEAGEAVAGLLQVADAHSKAMALKTYYVKTFEQDARIAQILYEDVMGDSSPNSTHRECQAAVLRHCANCSLCSTACAMHTQWRHTVLLMRPCHVGAHCA